MQRCIQISDSACCAAPDGPYLWIVRVARCAIDN